MPLRPTMATLIARLRRMISDRDAPQAFSDGDLQDVLDEHQTVARYLGLRAEGTIAPGGGVVTYKDFYADVGDWEDDLALVDAAWNPVTPTASDNRVGHWFFVSGITPAPGGSRLCVTGKFYDLPAAAADALEAWAAKVKLDFDYKTADQGFSRSQKMKALLDLAETYRAKARPQCGQMVRTDVV